MERSDSIPTELLEAKDFCPFLQKAKMIEPLRGGANNRVFSVHLPSQILIAKKYFHHPDDPRNRLETEYNFLSFLDDHGITSIPKPLVKYPLHHLAIYSFIKGNQVTNVSKNYVQQALEFFLAINKFKENATHLSKASDACFTIEEYLTSVDKRILRFFDIHPETSFEEEIVQFLRKQLYPFWSEIKNICSSSPDESITPDQRCLSPSDFGFHNILVNNDKCYFLDFEYAGWDDPAKMLSDFFLQPKVPVPRRFFSWFKTQVFNSLPNFEERLKKVFPICRIKWICIMLNSLTKVGKERRKFSNTMHQIDHQKVFEHVKQLYIKQKGDPWNISNF